MMSSAGHRPRSCAPPCSRARSSQEKGRGGLAAGRSPAARAREVVSIPLRPWTQDALFEHFDGCKLSVLLVGAGRFERPTPCAQGRCATRLRYAPTFVALLILNYFPPSPPCDLCFLRPKLYQNCIKTPFSLACLYQNSCPVRWR